MKPIQYRRGYSEFYKLKFKVTPSVLIPRPETELLVDEVINFINSKFRIANTAKFTILDIGTGAGNIAIALAKNLLHLGGVTIIAIDISEKALKVARQNAKLHGVENNVEFIQSDLLSSLNSELFSDHSSLIIVTNLPYIPSSRIPYLDSSVKDYEPHIALDGGIDGFQVYRKLFMQIQSLKLPLKLLIGEIDDTHGQLAIPEAKKYFPQAEIEVQPDLAHKQRVLIIKT